MEDRSAVTVILSASISAILSAFPVILNVTVLSLPEVTMRLLLVKRSMPIKSTEKLENVFVMSRSVEETT